MLSPEYQHKNQKRNLFQLFTDDIKQVNFYEAKKGAILGNHYHKETKEYFYITRGTVLLKTNQGKELAQRIVNKGEFFLVEPQQAVAALKLAHFGRSSPHQLQPHGIKPSCH